MSQYTFEPQHSEETNGLAIAGLVCAIVGIFTVGLLSPVALILSLVALGRPGGRGFAIAGIIISLLSMCGGLLLLLPALALALGLVAVAFIVMGEPEKLELTSDMINIVIAAKVYEEEQGVLPADLGQLNLRAPIMIDPWGNRYEYHFIDEEPGFDLISWGKDGQKGTDDDVFLTKLDETWEATGMPVLEISAEDDGGTVVFTLGDKVITVHGDEEGGRLTIDLGDRIIELIGGDDGGNIIITSSGDDDDVDEAPGSGEPDTEDETPQSQPDEEESDGESQ